MNILRYKQQAQGWHFRCSDAPDTSGMNSAAVAQAKMSQEQLDWAKQIYSETAPDRAAAIVRSNKVADAQLDAMNTQTALAKDYDTYNKTTFRPLEQGIVQSATEYDTPERRAAAVQGAGADVQQQIDSQQESSARDMERNGVNPNSGKAQSMQAQLGIAGAAAKAGAAYKAGKDVETQGYARKMDAVGLGKGLVGSQATSAQVANSAGSSSVNSGMASGNISAQGNQIMNSGYAGAQAGLAGSAGTFGAIAGVQQRSNAENGAVWGALGSVAGAAMGGPVGAGIGKYLGGSMG